ncbi:hypothetical protein ABEX29_03985 [Brevibacillus porteri]|uniref:hypothetical protein n=1 Tax=Brevibacillus porteri TaxID=2126350 RepID=UPI003D1CEFEB
MKILNSIVYGRKLTNSDYVVKDLIKQLFADSIHDDIHLEAVNYFDNTYKKNVPQLKKLKSRFSSFIEARKNLTPISVMISFITLTFTCFSLLISMLGIMAKYDTANHVETAINSLFSSLPIILAIVVLLALYYSSIMISREKTIMRAILLKEILDDYIEELKEIQKKEKEDRLDIEQEIKVIKKILKSS